jgi:hypothetical protein
LTSGGTIADKIRRGEIAVEDLPVLREMAEIEEACLVGVTPKTMVTLLEALFQHYPPRQLSEGGEKQVWRDWADDVGHLPPAVLAAACRAYRRSAARFAPTPGQLLALVDPGYTVRLRAVQHAIKLLGEKVVDSQKSQA